MAIAGKTAYQVWLDDEHRAMFEKLMVEERRRTSGMVEWLIRQEYARREALRAAEMQARQQFENQMAFPIV